MTKIIEAVKQSGNDEFYPTPPHIAEKLLEDIDWLRIDEILEPSAGKGDLIYAIEKAVSEAYKKTFEISDRIYDWCHYEISNIDCIEIDANLRAILNAINTRELNRINNIEVVHDDFLTYTSPKYYGAIIMNPPFSNGDEHLLKALEIMQYGGEIRCILNAETIRNPHTNKRKMLLHRLNEIGAEIKYIDGGFAQAENKTDVSIAIIKASVPKPEEQESEFYKRFKEATMYEQTFSENTEVSFCGFVEGLVVHYNAEVKASIAFINEYANFRRHIMDDVRSEYKKPILDLRVGDSSIVDDNGNIEINSYLLKVRLKYWRIILANKRFAGKLTSELQNKFQSEVNNLAKYDFTVFNIEKLLVEINASMIGGVKNAIFELFDKFSQHSYYPDAHTIHYYNGWKTNKAHKLGMKVIFPEWGMFDRDGKTDKWKLRDYNAYKILSDLEKTLNYLDGDVRAEVDILYHIQRAIFKGNYNNIECKHFFATFYKKGTIHLKFKNQELIDRFNIFVGRERAWLPPSYGKKSYSEMSPEEKRVIDEFEGEQKYNIVYQNRDAYIIETENILMLEIS